MPDITEHIQLTSDTAHEYEASWNYDDSKIVFIKNAQYFYKDEVWVADSDGAHQVKMFMNNNLRHPDWGQGGILVVASDPHPRDSHPNIWIIDNDLTKPRRLTTNKTDLKYASWNNDSTKILCLWKNNYNYEIYTMNPDATNQQRLTFFQKDVNSPAWSPDNAKIAFIFENDIWVMNTDATNMIQLTDDDYNQLDPTWSPDGEWIAFTSDEDGDNDIWLMRSDGTERAVFINKSKDQTDADWSHDGTKILYTSYEGGDGDTWVATLDFSLSAIDEPTPSETQETWSEEEKENIPRLVILGAVIAVLVIFFLVRRAIRSPRQR